MLHSWYSLRINIQFWKFKNHYSFTHNISFYIKYWWKHFHCPCPRDLYTSHTVFFVSSFVYCLLSALSSIICLIFIDLKDFTGSHYHIFKNALFNERMMTWHLTFIHHVDCSKENKSRISELSPSICRWAEPRAERDCYASLKGIPQKQKYLNKSISTTNNILI